MAKALAKDILEAPKTSIKSAIEKMDSSVFTEKDPGIEPKEFSVDEETVQAIAEKCAKPWIYGKALHRFAKQHNVDIRVVREIKAEVDKRKAVEAPEPVEEFEV